MILGRGMCYASPRKPQYTLRRGMSPKLYSRDEFLLHLKLSNLILVELPSGPSEKEAYCKLLTLPHNTIIGFMGANSGTRKEANEVSVRKKEEIE